MIDIEEEIRKLAKKQKDENKWEEAVGLYKKIYFPQCDRWLAWEYSYCLKKLSRLDDAIAISKKLYQREKQFYHNNNFLSWLLYEKYFNHPKEKYSYQELNHLYEIVMSVTTFTMQDDKSAYESIIIKMLKLLKRHENNSALKIIGLLEKLDAQKLSTKVGRYKQNGIEKEYQSQKEMFYAMKTKAMLDSKRYTECISCCNEALACFEQFHHDNKIWIIARKAVSMAQIGKFDEGILELKNALISKKHWSLFEKLAEIYLIKRDLSNALLYFSMAAISNDSPKMKVSLYMSMANLLYLMDKNENAWRHLCFAKKIRKKEQWNIPVSMQQLYEKLSVFQFKEDVQLYQLKKYWLQIIYQVLGKHHGIINKVNMRGKTGFISSDSKSYFFRGNSFIEKVNFKERDKVIFCLVESFDIKKQHKSLECDYIKIDE